MEVRNWSEQSNNKHISKDLNMKKHVRFVWRMKLAVPWASFKVFFKFLFWWLKKSPKNLKTNKICMNLLTEQRPSCGLYSSALHEQRSDLEKLWMGFCKGVRLTSVTVPRIHGEKHSYKNCWTVSLWQTCRSSWTRLEVSSLWLVWRQQMLLSDGAEHQSKKGASEVLLPCWAKLLL